MSATKKVISTNAKKFDKQQELHELSSVSSSLNQENVVVIERPHFSRFRAIIQNGENRVISEGAPSKDISKVIEILNNRYKKNLSFLFFYFGKNDMVLFGFLGKNEEVYFDDIFLNENWVSYDDLQDAFSYSGLLLSPVLFSGKFSKNKVEELTENKNSLFHDDRKIRSIVVKPTFEKNWNKKRNAGIYKAENFSKNKKKKTNLKTKQAGKKILNDLADDFFFSNFIEEIQYFEGIELSYKNKNAILSRLTNTFFDNFPEHIEEISKKYDAKKEAVFHYIKRELPKIFLSKISLS